MKPQGTYLLWLDFSAYSYTDDELHAKIHDQAKLILNRGTDFWKRRKLACPPQCGSSIHPH